VQGDAAVEVEVRASAADSYGQGRKQTMLFKDFIQQLRAGAANLYLSTQEVRQLGSSWCQLQQSGKRLNSSMHASVAVAVRCYVW
jgi:hypothetical protein